MLAACQLPPLVHQVSQAAAATGACCAQRAAVPECARRVGGAWLAATGARRHKQAGQERAGYPAESVERDQVTETQSGVVTSPTSGRKGCWHRLAAQAGPAYTRRMDRLAFRRRC